MEGQSFGRNQAHGQFAGMQADMHLGIDPVKIVEHLHVEIEVVHGNVPVLRHHEVQADKARIGLSQFETEHNLRKYLLLWEARAGPDRGSGPGPRNLGR